MPPMPIRIPRWGYAAIAAVLLAAGGAGAYLIWGRAPGDVSNPDAEFTVPAPAPKPPKRKKEKPFVWPIFGYTPDRAKYLPARLDPPFRKLWRYRADSLLEFPPVLAQNTLFFVTNRGTAVAVDARTGRRRWKRKVGTLSAASPAWWRGTLFVVTLDGRLTALRARGGRVLWTKDVPSRTESSPYVREGRVYFGSEDGTVYAVRARNGRTIWTYRAPGAVKAALAFSGGRLFFGDYAGVATAIRARDGARVWSTSTAGLALGRSGRFYSTPAVAFGRVYMGNTDGRVYSFTARGGETAWTRSTGAYVYSGPAAANVPRLGPTVFVGSYSGRFYALDARSGNERWSHQAAGRISGAAGVIGRVAYIGNLGNRDTEGLDVRTGRRVFRWSHGGFAPPISDGKRLYVTGYASLFGFAPRKHRRAHGHGRDRSTRGASGRRSGPRARGTRRGRARSGARTRSG
jgi:outer membrane protein assembly factor BamB